MHSAEVACKCLRQGLISAYRQTVWTLIRQLLQLKDCLFYAFAHIAKLVVAKDKLRF